MTKTGQTPETYYTYIYAYPDGEVFYVGKGSGTRLFAHEKEAKTGCECHKCGIIRSIWQSGKTVQKRIVFETFDASEALENERYLITQYRGPKLTNVMFNPEGEPPPRPPTPDTDKIIHLTQVAHSLNCTVEQLIAFMSNSELRTSLYVFFMKRRYTSRNGTRYPAVQFYCLWQYFDFSSYRLSLIKKHVGLLGADNIELIRNLMLLETTGQ